MKRQKLGMISIFMLALYSGILASISLKSPIKAQDTTEQILKIKTAANNYYLDFDVMYGGNDDDRGEGIALDDLGNVYITGYTEYIDGEGIISCWAFIAKYDSAGNSLMNITWGGKLNANGNDIALDDSGNIYVSGTYKGDAFISKYDSAGNSLMNITGDDDWMDSDYGYDIALDISGNIYISGTIENDAEVYDVFIAKFNSSGVLQWESIWSGPENDYPRDIELDDSGNVYITGKTDSFGAGGEDAFIAKFDNSGNSVMNMTYGGSLDDWGQGITLDGLGNIYITGRTQPPGAGAGDDAFIAKFNSTGHLKMNITWGSWNIDSVHGYGITLDVSENIYISGEVYNIYKANYDLFIAKYDSTGVLLWNTTWGGNTWDYGRELALDGSGNIYITGYTYKSGMGDHVAFLVKYSSGGPRSFILDTNTTLPDTDGIFWLNWSESVGAQNYSIYWSDNPNVNDADTLYIEGLNNNSVFIKGFEPGTFYFRAVSYNETGSSWSNELTITIQVGFPPGTFILDTNTTLPDTDGMFWLNWSESVGAQNYSIYWSATPNVDDVDTLYVNGLINDSMLIKGFNSGTYYFRMVSYNETGSTWSNELTISVQLVADPGLYNLDTNTALPDIDGIFWLNWSESIGADNYSIYWSMSSNVNETDTLYVDGLNNFSMLIKGFNSGTYYFRMISYNETGSTWSNELTITIQITSIDNSDDGDDNGAQEASSDNKFFLLIGLFGVLSVIGVILLTPLIKKRKQSISWKDPEKKKRV